MPGYVIHLSVAEEYLRKQMMKALFREGCSNHCYYSVIDNEVLHSSCNSIYNRFYSGICITEAY